MRAVQQQALQRRGRRGVILDEHAGAGPVGGLTGAPAEEHEVVRPAAAVHQPRAAAPRHSDSIVARKRPGAMGVAEDHVGVAEAEAVGHLPHRAQPGAAQLLGRDVGAQRAQPGTIERRHGEREGARERQPAQLSNSRGAARLARERSPRADRVDAIQGAACARVPGDRVPPREHRRPHRLVVLDAAEGRGRDVPARGSSARRSGARSWARSGDSRGSGRGSHTRRGAPTDPDRRRSRAPARPMRRAARASARPARGAGAARARTAPAPAAHARPATTRPADGRGCRRSPRSRDRRAPARDLRRTAARRPSRSAAGGGAARARRRAGPADRRPREPRATPRGARDDSRHPSPSHCRDAGRR